MPFCSNCGKELHEADKFCPSCGTAQNVGTTSNNNNTNYSFSSQTNQQKTVTLKVTRKSGFVAAAMPYKILIDDKEVGKLMPGKSLTVEIPAVPTKLAVNMVGNSLTFHEMKDEEQLFPEKAKRGLIECTIDTKANVLGILTSAVFKAPGTIHILTEYL